MRILLVSDTYPPDVNGAARFTERLGAGLVRRGHEVHQIAPSTRFGDHSELHEGIIVHRVRSVRYPIVDVFRFVYPWDAFPRVRKLIDEIDPDVIHVQNHFVLGRAAIRAAVKRDIPLVATNHFMPENLTEPAMIPKPLERVANKLAYDDLRRQYRHAVVLTAPTPRAVEVLETSARLTGAIPLSCGIDTDVYADAAAKAEPNPVPVVLFVGRLDQEKRVNELIKAAAGLPDDVPYMLDIIGDGSHRESWTKLAESLGLVPDKCRFRGFISEDELVEAYGTCDIFCIPGVAELQSLVTLEAMSAGKPVIAANAMALPHLVHPEENGYLYTPGDVDELRGYLKDLLTDPEKRARMGAASKQIVSTHGVDSTLDRFEELYDQATSA